MKVTNTGDVAGKEVVQLYYTAPYHANGIEKSHVVLGGFEKTKVLQPNESQEVTVTMQASDMKSYDYNDVNENNHKGYELEHGTYTLKVMKNAHDVVDSVTYEVTSDIKITTDESTGYEVKNRFDNVSDYVTDELQKNYLSRNDFDGTFPETLLRIEASQEVIDGLSAQFDLTLDPDSADKPYYSATTPTMGADNDVLLNQLVGKEYDDQLWDTFLDQLTKDQMLELTLKGHYKSGADIPELGITKTFNFDGPWGFHLHDFYFDKYPSADRPFNGYVNNIITAATFNKQLAYNKGRAVGNEALWANIGGWYAPGCNIHRSQFGGRNGEYFAEDAYLSGIMSASVVQGAQAKGLLTYVKHFALNEQETDRVGILTWANEQSMREIYFKPFEIAVKEGEPLGIMSAFNRIGYEWTGADYDLITEILKNEWGFRGNVVTDMYQDSMGAVDRMIRAGGSLLLNGGKNLKYETDSATTLTCLRNSAHDVLYAHANSLAMNTADTPYVPDKIDTFNGKTLAVATAGTNYSQSVATATLSTLWYDSPDNTQITYALNESSSLPAGLTVTADGRVTGKTDVEVNNHKFLVDATYDGFTKSAEFTISVVNLNGAIVYEANPNLGAMKKGETYNISLAGAYIYKPNATAGETLPNITYTLKNGSVLPQGLTLSKDGKLTGTPTQGLENYFFTVTASADGFKSVDLTFTFSVNVPLTMPTTVKTLLVGRYGETYVDTLDRATCENEVTYALKEIPGNTLPAGLSLTKGGVITGKTSEAVAKHTFIVVVSAYGAQPVERTYSIRIGIAFVNFMKPEAAVVGKEYDATVAFAQGTMEEITYTAEGLPNGMELLEDGTLTGKPKKAGNYAVTLTANADGYVGDTVTFNFTVEGNGSLPLGAIIGIVGGSIVLVAGVVVLVIFLLKKRKGNRPNNDNPPSGQTPNGDNDGGGSASGANLTQKTKKNKGQGAKVSPKIMTAMSITFSALFAFLHSNSQQIKRLRRVLPFVWARSWVL